MEESARLRILQSPLFDDVVEQFAPGSILHDQEQLLARLDNLVELHDVRVSHDLQDVNLAHDPRYIRLVLDHVFFEHLDRNFLVSELVDSLAHLTKRAFSDGLSNHVVADEAAIGWSTFLTALCSLLPVTLFSSLARLVIC